MSADLNSTLYDQVVSSLKNHRVIVAVIIFLAVIVGINELTGALASIAGRLRPRPALEIVDVRVLSSERDLQAFYFSWGDSAAAVLPPSDAISDTSEMGRHFALRALGVPGSFPVLDVLVRNTSEEVVVLKRIDVKALRLKERSDFRACSPFAPTWRFHILLESDKERQRIQVHASQRVLPKDMDRFAIVLGHDGGISEAEYNVDIDLHWNQKGLSSIEDLRVPISAPDCGAGPKLTRPIGMDAVWRPHR